MQNYSRRPMLSLAAMLLVLTMLLTGCTVGSDTSWVYRSGDAVMPAGAYLSCQISAISDAQLVNGDMSLTIEQLMKATIEGIPAEKWISNRAEQYAKRYFLVEQRFKEMGLDYTELLAAAGEYALEETWAQNVTFYNKNGISKSSVALTVENATKIQEIFHTLYGAGGEREVSEDELKAVFESTYLYLNALVAPKVVALPEGSAKTAEESTAEIKALVDTHVARLESGEKIEALAFEMETLQAGIYGDSADTVEEYPEGSLELFVPAGYREYYPAELINAVDYAENGSFGVVETANAFYVYGKLDVMTSDEFERYRVNVLTELKMDEFNQELLEQALSIEVETNKSAVNRYKPSKLDLSAPAA